MGTTLPLLTEYYRRSATQASRLSVGRLYAANTIGAAIGIFIAGFVLIEVLGVRSTTQVAAAANFLVALLAFRWSKRETAAAATGAARSGAGSGIGTRSARLAMGVITATGALALGSEVLWTRALASLVGNSTYVFSAIVIVFLVGIASGSWATALLLKRVIRPLSWLVACLFGMGVWSMLSVEYFKYVATVQQQQPDAFAQTSVALILLQQMKAVGVLYPLAFLSGACFPLVIRMLGTEVGNGGGATVARAYAWNTVGAVGGSLLAGFALAPQLDFLAAIYVVAALYGATAVVTLAATFGQGRAASGPWLPLAAMGTASILVAFLGAMKIAEPSYFLTRLAAKYPDYSVPFHKAGMQGVTTVMKYRANSRADMLLVNGNGMTVKVNDTKMMAHVPMLLHPDPENTLVICLGMGTTFRSAVTHGKRVTVVEIVKEVAEALEYYYPDADQFRNLNGSRIVVDDGRNFLKLSEEKFDVITLDPPPPIDAAGVNSLYSKEFIELAKTRLKAGGIMAHWVPLPGTSSGVDDYFTVNSLLYTFATVFPYAYVHQAMNGIGLHVVGSMTPIDFSPERIGLRMAQGMVADDLREWTGPTLSWFTSNWVTPLSRLNETNAMAVTDDKALLEFYLWRTVLAHGTKTRPRAFW
jgi:spermidine synthase